jgi:hypothetical protein
MRRTFPKNDVSKATKAIAKDVDRLKLALWYIGKCGSLEDAQRAFDAAVAATRSLERKD